jgi:branched-chain amino acid transport system ATP-binding protein
LLEVSELVARYGSVEALRGVSLEVRAGEIVALIGANGAGKSTLLRSITGLLPPVGGRVRLDGSDLTGRPPEEILRAGIALVPERRRVFGGLTVLDNLHLGGYALPRGRGFRERLDEGVGEAYRLFPVLRQRRDALVLANWVHRPFVFLGMIGSRRKKLSPGSRPLNFTSSRHTL